MGPYRNQLSSIYPDVKEWEHLKIFIPVGLNFLLIFLTFKLIILTMVFQVDTMIPPSQFERTQIKEKAVALVLVSQ